MIEYRGLPSTTAPRCGSSIPDRLPGDPGARFVAWRHNRESLVVRANRTPVHPSGEEGATHARISRRAATTGWRFLPDRWRYRDHARLSRGPGPPLFRRLPPPAHTGGGERPQKYFRTYAELARRHGAGLVLETATWRSNLDWGTKLGYGAGALDDANRHAVRLLEEIRTQYGSDDTPIVISGCIGPRGDGYVPDIAMSEREAEAYHRRQIETFADTAADLVTAITMNYAEEAAGVALAARRASMPVVLSFTVETDGRLPTGQSLGDAIRRVDDATSGYPRTTNQLRASQPLRRGAASRRGVDLADPRSARECVQDQPRRAERIGRARRGGSSRNSPGVRGAAEA